MQKIKTILRAVFKKNWLPTTNQPITGVVLWDQLQRSCRSNRERGGYRGSENRLPNFEMVKNRIPSLKGPKDAYWIHKWANFENSRRLRNRKPQIKMDCNHIPPAYTPPPTQTYSKSLSTAEVDRNSGTVNGRGKMQSAMAYYWYM